MVFVIFGYRVDKVLIEVVIILVEFIFDVIVSEYGCKGVYVVKNEVSNFIKIVLKIVFIIYIFKIFFFFGELSLYLLVIIVIFGFFVIEWVVFIVFFFNFKNNVMGIFKSIVFIFLNFCNIKVGLVEINFGNEGFIVVLYFVINKSKVIFISDFVFFIFFLFVIFKNLVRILKIIVYNIGNKVIIFFLRLNFIIFIYFEIIIKYSVIKCNFVFFIFFFFKYYFK